MEYRRSGRSRLKLPAASLGLWHNFGGSHAGLPAGDPAPLLSSLDASLNRMGLDYVDIFCSHRFDPETPLEETMKENVDALAGQPLTAEELKEIDTFAVDTAGTGIWAGQG